MTTDFVDLVSVKGIGAMKKYFLCLIPFVLLFGFFAGDCAAPTPTFYNVTLKENGGKIGSRSIISVESGKTVAPLLSTELPTRTNFTLLGWNTKEDGSGTEFKFGTTTVTNNITIYAQWRQNNSPTITSFTPTSGLVGSDVTIKGTNFSASPVNNTVKFNSVTATVKSAATTQIVAVVPIGATTGKISISVEGGAFILATTDFIVNVPAPTIASFNPTSGAVGTTVTITGTNFSTTATNNAVKFNNVVATVTNSTATTITTTVPTGATTGKISVTVGGQTATSATDFTVDIPVPAPTIASFNPTSGAVGTTVTITGTNFSTTATNNAVKFNNVVATVTNSTATTITTTVPTGATTGKISVIVSGQTATSATDFTVDIPVPAPTIASFTPTSGGRGSTVTITGTNFSTVLAENKVWIGGIPATVTAATATSITAVVQPFAGTGAGKISVEIGTSTQVQSADDFTVVDHTITGFTPDNGAIGSSIVINGTNFDPNLANYTANFDVLNNVRFTSSTSTVIATVTAATSTSLTVTVPTGAITGKVSVSIGITTVTSATDFTVDIPVPAPTIASFNPTSGAVGTTVTITGTNFSTTATNNAVKFNNTVATVTNSTATTITTTVPTGATTGKISVTVGGQTATSATDFTVDIPVPAPTIASFNPTSGAVGTTVTITGTNFSTTSANNAVKFNNVVATVTNSTATTITTTVPTGATTGKISVTVGGQTATSATDFTVDIPVPAPTIASFNPTSGAVGTTVTITGTNFSTTATNNAVKFNNVVATVTNSTATTITTTVPTGATTGKISVIVSGQTATSATDFTVDIPVLTPTIASFNPTSGAVGTTVTITGTNFSTTATNNAVKFNNTVATVTNSTATTITTTVPTGATTGKISVTVGGQTATSATDFTVDIPVSAPTIASFTPTSGGRGSTVTITGTNFSTVLADNKVWIGGIPATVTAATATSITAVVQPFAITGAAKISVQIGTSTQVQSTTNFTVVDHTITGFTPDNGAIGSSIVINGTNFDPNLANYAGQNSVRFRSGTGTVVATVTGATSTELTVTVPEGATTGTVVTSATDFTVDIPVPAPTIASFNPTSGAVGTTVTITGTNFSTTSANNAVKFNNVVATVTNSTATTITTTVPTGATTGKISVTVGGQTATSATDFTVDIPVPAPTIASFNPTSGAVGTTVTITGTNFSTTASNNAVKFNNVVATVTNSTATTITTTVPTGATTGKISVTVGGQTATSATDFTVDIPVTAPTIASFTPTSGGRGSTVTITGTNFSTVLADNKVWIGGIPATVTAATATSITAVVQPFAITGAAKISVQIGTSTQVQSTTNFTVVDHTITGFTPDNGAIGSSIVINGTNFDPNLANYAGQNSVRFRSGTGTVVATVTGATSTELTVTVPTGAITGKVSVSIGITTVTSATDFTVDIPVLTPTIASFNPTSGAVGTTVTITGTNFSTTATNNAVKFNNTVATVTNSTATTITTTVPTGATTGKISVTVGGQTATSATDFTVDIPVSAPTIASFNPTSGGRGSTVTITGTNFSTVLADNKVWIGGIPATVTAATATSITAVVQPFANTGAAKISVQIGTSTQVQSADDFTVVDHTITGFTPDNGAVGSSIVINGTNFDPNLANYTANFDVLNNVRFTSSTSTVIATVTAATSTSLTVTVPTGAITGKVSVSIGITTVISATDFTVDIPVSAPTIVSFNPTSGGRGSTVTITGTNFSTVLAENKVWIGGIPATVTAATATSITAVVQPFANTGAAKISVQIGTSNQIQSTTNFTVVDHTITGFTPDNGAIGSSIVINGTNFDPNLANYTNKLNNIHFRSTTGTVLATVTAATSTELTVTVPEGATTGTVTVAIGVKGVTSATDFTVTVPFTISSTSFTNGAALGSNSKLIGAYCGGSNVSPQISWSNAPAGTKSFAIRVYDGNNSNGVPINFLHWLVVNIPTTTNSVAENAGVEDATPGGGTQLDNDYSHAFYDGPCPPPFGPTAGTHTYEVTVYALNVASVRTTSTGDAMDDINANTIESKTLTFTYRTQP
ncbi:hypothetical protein CHS0354_023858 [Potamilus streckersoni]|uniref:IPT/TIG domain-containing protein n=1 Tax=Potamilus streckersoni TaxID=2493646 RepID=A0AAE0VMI8_9BIVA|nr:hypothetical protein CHS0354_023858 [Potamilus streckersoni]